MFHLIVHSLLMLVFDFRCLYPWPSDIADLVFWATFELSGIIVEFLS